MKRLAILFASLFPGFVWGITWEVQVPASYPAPVLWEPKGGTIAFTTHAWINHTPPPCIAEEAEIAQLRKENAALTKFIADIIVDAAERDRKSNPYRR